MKVTYTLTCNSGSLEFAHKHELLAKLRDLNCPLTNSLVKPLLSTVTVVEGDASTKDEIYKWETNIDFSEH